MNAKFQINAVSEANERARRRLLSVNGEPLLLADWVGVTFIHYRVPAALLRPAVPFELDLRDGEAWVSLVAFTMSGMRPRRGGRPGRWLFWPVAANNFLNARTYVRHRGETGIYFLTEWLDNRLSVLLGPGTFGLPYRFARAEYRGPENSGTLSGLVSGESGAGFAYTGRFDPAAHLESCAADSLDDALLERYTAFTSRNGRRRFFRIWHPPWAQTRLHVNVLDDSLLRECFPWFAAARPAGANYSPGACGVWMGRPQRIGERCLRRPRRGLSRLFELP